MSLLRRLKDAVLPDYTNIPRPGGETVGGVPARALVVDTSGGMSGKSTATWVRKKLELQLVDRPEQRASIECYLSERVFVATTPGRELPVRVDEDTGAILGVDHEAWEAEVERIYAGEPGRP